MRKESAKMWQQVYKEHAYLVQLNAVSGIDTRKCSLCET